MSTNLNNPIWILEDDRYQIKDFQINERVNDTETCVFTVYINKNLASTSQMIRERQEIAVEFETGKYKHFYVERVIASYDSVTYECVDWFTVYKKYYFGKLFYNENNDFKIDVNDIPTYLISGLDGYNPKNKLKYINFGKFYSIRLQYNSDIADYQVSKHNIGKESFGEVFDKVLNFLFLGANEGIYINTTSTKRDEFQLRVERYKRKYASLNPNQSKHILKYNENVIHAEVERDLGDIVNRVHYIYSMESKESPKTMELIKNKETGESYIEEYGEVVRFIPGRIREGVIQNEESIELYGTRLGKTVVNYNVVDSSEVVKQAREQLKPFRTDLYKVDIVDNYFPEQLRVMNTIKLQYPKILFNDYGESISSKFLYITGRTLEFKQGKFLVTNVQLSEDVDESRDRTELRKNIDDLNKQIQEIELDYKNELKKLYETLNKSTEKPTRTSGDIRSTQDNGSNFWSASLAPRLANEKGLGGVGITVKHDEIFFQTIGVKRDKFNTEKDVLKHKRNDKGEKIEWKLKDDYVASAPMVYAGGQLNVPDLVVGYFITESGGTVIYDGNVNSRKLSAIDSIESKGTLEVHGKSLFRQKINIARNTNDLNYPHFHTSIEPKLIATPYLDVNKDITTSSISGRKADFVTLVLGSEGNGVDVGTQLRILLRRIEDLERKIERLK